MNKIIKTFLIMLLITVSCYGVTPPTNKSVNGIVDWVDKNFTASPTFITSGTTQIYTEKSVGIGTSTPDVNYKLDVVGDSRFDGDVLLSGELKNVANPYNRIHFNKYGLEIYGVSGSYIFYIDGNGITTNGYSCHSTQRYAWAYTNCWLTANTTDYALQFFTDSTERGRFSQNGNFLLGSTVDDGINKLQVTGDSKFNGDVKIESAPDIYTPTLLLHNTKQTGIGVDDTSDKMTIFSDGHRMIQVNYPYVDFLLYTTFSQPLRAPNGSGGSPAYTGVYDTNSGMFFTGSDELGFSTGGVEAARFTASHTLNLSNTPVYADNAAALAGGLVAGDVYRTSTGVLMITY